VEAALEDEAALVRGAHGGGGGGGNQSKTREEVKNEE
jgi:hypothetical protein